MKVGGGGNGNGHISNWAYNILKIRKLTEVTLVKAIDCNYKKGSKEIGKNAIGFGHK